MSADRRTFLGSICWGDVRVLYRRELTSALRETNILLYSILVPVLLYPMMVWMLMSVLTFINGQSEHRVARVVLDGSPAQHRALWRRLKADRSFVLVKAPHPQEALERGRVDVVVKFFSTTPPGSLGVRLDYDASRQSSKAALEKLEKALRLYRRASLERRARQLGLRLSALQPFWIKSRNVASGRQVGRYLLGVLLPFTLIVILTMAGMYPAVDSTAGERERGTWETLMTTATPRINLVLAKYLYVCTMASLAGVLNLAAMLFAMRSIIAPMSRRLAHSLSFTITPGSLLLILAGSVLMAMMLGAVMMVLASFARTFREGQAMVTPVLMLALLPVSVLANTTLRLGWKLSLVPVVNLALVWREALTGRYDWGPVGLTFAVLAVCVGLCVWAASRVLIYEDMVMGSYDGSLWHFVRSRLLGPGGGSK